MANNIQGQKWLDGDVPTRQRMNWKNHIYDTGANINALDYVTGLVSRYAFGGNANDSAGTNNGTANGSPTYGAAVYGQGMGLNGTSQYVRVPDAANLRFTTAFTIAWWMASSAPSLSFIVSKHVEATSGYEIQYNVGGGSLTVNIHRGGAAPGYDQLTSNWVNDGNSHFIAVTFSSGTITIYVDGVADKTGSSAVSSIPTNTTDLFIGCRDTIANFFQCQYIDHMQFFNTALTAAQVKQVYSDCHGGMLATCNSTGSGFTSDITYRRDVENTTWEQLIDTVSSQTITGAKTFNNANVNLSNNTVTDTSTAAGDLAKSNGTKFLRFAKGAAFQVLRTNSGATDIEYANCRFTELGRTQLGADGTSISVASLPTVKRLIVLAEIKVGAGTSTTGSIRFNNDSGTNYAYRYSENGAAEVTGTSQTSISFHSGVMSASETANVMMHISNDSTNRKLSYITVARDGAVGAGTAPVRLEEAATWDNTASQINRIDFLGTNNFLSGSRVTVYGAD